MKVPLRKVVEAQMGYQARGRIEHDPNGQYHVLQMSDLDDDGCVKDVSKMIRVMPNVEGPGRYAVCDDSVVFQARGNRNRAFVLRGVPPDTLASNHFYILRIKPSMVLLRFLAWSVNQPSAQAHLSGRAQGTTMMLVPKDAFESLEIDVPPLEVQRAIVELAALRQRERGLVENLERKRDTLIRALSLRAISHKTE